MSAFIDRTGETLGLDKIVCYLGDKTFLVACSACGETAEVNNRLLTVLKGRGSKRKCSRCREKKTDAIVPRALTHDESETILRVARKVAFKTLSARAAFWAED